MSGPASLLPTEGTTWAVGVAVSITLFAAAALTVRLMRRSTRDEVRWIVPGESYTIIAYERRIEAETTGDPTLHLLHEVRKYFPGAITTPAQPRKNGMYVSQVDLRRVVTKRDTNTLAFILSHVTSM